jgi:arylsulfatase A-like enzyme
MKVVVLVVNGLHCGPIGAYGNDWVGTPAFDRLAAEGIVFDQHLADVPSGAGARQSWRTGRYHLPTQAAAPSPDLLGTLRQAGIATALVCEDTPPAAFAEGWDAVNIVAPNPDDPALEAVLEAVGEALDALEDVDNWLLWVELNTLVPPWRFPDEFFEAASSDEAEAKDEEEDEDDEEEDEDDEDEDDEDDEDEGDEEVEDAGSEEPLLPFTDPQPGPLGDDPDDVTFLRLQETYAAAVRYVDAGLEQILESLDDDVTLFVTSDCGTVLGEHGVVGVLRPRLHEELLHLPLLMHVPGSEAAGRRVAALTQSLDLLPTLLDLFGVAIPPEVHGRSLVPLMQGDETPVRDYACSGLQIGLAIELALRTPDWAFLLPLQGEVEDAALPQQLYARPEDRWEVNDVRQHHLELAEDFAEVLQGFAKAAQQAGPLVPPVLRDETATSSLVQPGEPGA